MMGWTREHRAYWSDCRRYCVQRTASTAMGPWFVTHDPDGENAGWGDIIVPRSRTMRDAKVAAERHAAKGALA